MSNNVLCVKGGKGRMCICIKEPGSIHKDSWARFITSGFGGVGRGGRSREAERVDLELYTF